MAGLFDTLAAQSAMSRRGLLAFVKRRAYFAFHFDDIMRVNNVRNAWKIQHPDAPEMRSFQDSSLWESRKLENEDTLKRLMREGVQYTSAVCVLAGRDTWSRRWVRYEIARAVIDNRGLLTVHLNGIRHHQSRMADGNGMNPLHFMGVGKLPNLNHLSPSRYALFEFHSGVWHRYQDHSAEVDLPRYLPDPELGYVTPLSAGTAEYDYAAQNGSTHIGSWIDTAAQAVGR